MQPWLIRTFFLLATLTPGAAQAPIITTSNVNVRVMAANLSSSNLQRYEAPGLRIFQALRPDVVAIQEFNYASTNGAGLNTTNALREMIDSVFGTNFACFREPSPYSIPNGIISRWPILAAGSWEDPDAGVNDRGFAWARIDMPGTNDLYVVSVHLKASGGDAGRRHAEALILQSLIQSNFPPQAFIVVAGDLNIDRADEAALTTFKTFLSDTPTPTDALTARGTNTNAGRTERYDYVLPSFNLAARQVPTVIGSRTFASGLVFDSDVFTPLSEAAPVRLGDSHVTGMQHMAVVKDFRVSFTVTNFVTVPPPVVRWISPNSLRWSGPAHLTYTVQSSSTLTQWSFAGPVSSPTTNYIFPVPSADLTPRFFRVTWP